MIIATEILAEQIVRTVTFNTTMDEQQLNKRVEEMISWHIDDFLKLAKNIKDTSLNEKDRIARLIDAEEKYGLPKTHLL